TSSAKDIGERRPARCLDAQRSVSCSERGSNRCRCAGFRTLPDLVAAEVSSRPDDACLYSVAGRHISACRRGGYITRYLCAVRQCFPERRGNTDRRYGFPARRRLCEQPEDLRKNSRGIHRAGHRVHRHAAHVACSGECNAAAWTKRLEPSERERVSCAGHLPGAPNPWPCIRQLRQSLGCAQVSRCPSRKVISARDDGPGFSAGTVSAYWWPSLRPRAARSTVNARN